MLRGSNPDRIRGVALPPPPPQSGDPPVLVIQEPLNGATITQFSTPFWATATDTDGIDHVELYVNDIFQRSEIDPPFGWGGPDGVPPLNLSPFAEGPITFKAIAFDRGTPQQSTTLTHTCTLDVGEPPPQPTAPPLFDGQASRMISVQGSTVKHTDANWPGGSNASQNPIIWGDPPFTSARQGMYFMFDSMRLVTDPTYGKVWQCEIGPGDTNPYFDQPTKPNGEVTVQRPISMGQWDWYADAHKVQTPYTMMSFNVISQYGYPSLSSPPLSISFDNNGFGIDRHVGMIPTGQFLPQTVEKPRFYTMAQVYDRWVEIVIGVRWAVDNTGEIHVFARCPALGESSFIEKFSHFNTPTFQYKQGQSVKTSANDKMGLYFGESSSPPTNRVQHRGFTRWDNQADAIGSMG